MVRDILLFLIIEEIVGLWSVLCDEKYSLSFIFLELINKGSICYFLLN